MTNKEAISILRSRRTCMECVRNVAIYEKSCNECNEAFDMAIKALEDAEEWDKLKLICANEGVIVYKIKENNNADSH